MFSTFQNLSKEFPKFAALYIADGKSDPNNKPTFASSLVRIPRSFFAKCLEDGRGLEESKVSILQKWNGIAPKMPLEMLTDFKGHLVSLKIQKLEEEQGSNSTIIVVVVVVVVIVIIMPITDAKLHFHGLKSCYKLR